MALLVVTAVGEQLLELVDDQQELAVSGGQHLLDGAGDADVVVPNINET